MDRKAEIINVSRDCWLLVNQLIALLPGLESGGSCIE
jgi:hypothetical protein